jgi:hypothetical protein
VDHEVARTLGELELKLRELERELAELGRQTVEPEVEQEPVGSPVSMAPPGAATGASSRAPQPHSPEQRRQPPAAVGRLVDEAIEPPPAPPIEPPPGRSAEPPAAPAAVAPSSVAATLRYSMEAQETAFGEIPATHDARETIDLVELVGFRDKLQRTLQELIDEYSRLLSLGPRR